MSRRVVARTEGVARPLIAVQKSAEGIVGRCRRSARVGTLARKGRNGQGSHDRERAAEGPNDWEGASRTRDSWVTCGRKSSSDWPS